MKCFLALASLLLVSLSAQAKLVTKVVPYEHDGVKLQGYLAYDDTKVHGKAPGILVVHEWWGHNEYVRSRAEQLADLGYVAFALDMYGAGVTAETPQKAGELASAFYGKPLMASRAQAGLDVLVSQANVDSNNVAAIGYCFGGAVVQALAFSGAPLKGIVSFHGSLIAPDEAAAKALKAHVLICHGAADSFIPASAIEAFIKGVNDGHIDCQFVSYSGAVHAFTNPKADAVAAATGLKGIGYNEAADKRSWLAMKSFFGEIFSK